MQHVIDGVEFEFKEPGGHPIIWGDEIAYIGPWALAVGVTADCDDIWWGWAIYLTIPDGDTVIVDDSQRSMYDDHPLHQDIESARSVLLERWSDIMTRIKEHRPLFDENLTDV